MPINSTSRSGPATALELRKLPPGERETILEAAAERAEADYRTDFQLTAFEPLGLDDLYGDSSQTR